MALSKSERNKRWRAKIRLAKTGRTEPLTFTERAKIAVGVRWARVREKAEKGEKGEKA
jgi:hypothetical protein